MFSAVNFFMFLALFTNFKFLYSFFFVCSTLQQLGMVVRSDLKYLGWLNFFLHLQQLGWHFFITFLTLFITFEIYFMTFFFAWNTSSNCNAWPTKNFKKMVPNLNATHFQDQTNGLNIQSLSANIYRLDIVFWYWCMVFAIFLI